MSTSESLWLPNPSYTRPYAQLSWMTVVLLGVAGVAGILRVPLTEIFLANKWLNGLIAGVFVIGIFACIWQAARIAPAAKWAERFAAGREGIEAPPHFLAAMSSMLGASLERRPLTPVTARVLIDAVYARVSESRDIARYIAGLLVFLGLLGTFWGLARTIPALIETIRALSPREGEESLDAFARLTAGFEGQLSAMGTAFSTSLMGLAGSLVIGLLDLLAGHAQNRFIREFEQWATTAARIESQHFVDPEPQDAPSFAVNRRLESLVELNARQIASIIDALQSTSSADPERVRAHIQALELHLSHLAKSGRADPDEIRTIAKDVYELRHALGATRERNPSGRNTRA